MRHRHHERISRTCPASADCAFSIIVIAAVIIAGGCSTQSGGVLAPTVATDEQVALLPNGAELFSPVSGNRIAKSNQTPSVVYKDRLYFFCCQSHMRQFCADPERYVEAVKSPNGLDINSGPVKDVTLAATTPSSGPDPNIVYDIAIGSSPVLGPEDAKVTIVEFADMQCPYCIREWPKIRQILTEYPRDVRLVFKHYPLSSHTKAKPVHAALELALRNSGTDAFWKMHDMIIARPQNLDPNDLRVYAQSLKLDMAAFDQTLVDQSKMDELIETDMTEARKHGVRGTPTVFVNGRMMTDRSIEAYKARIKQILGEAEAKK